VSSSTGADSGPIPGDRGVGTRLGLRVRVVRLWRTKKAPRVTAGRKRGALDDFPLVPSPMVRLTFPYLNRLGAARRLLPSSEGLTADDVLSSH